MDATSSPSRLASVVHGVVVVIGGVGLAGACFLVLPLLEAISATPVADLTVVSIDTATLAPPPPPPEVEEEEKKPDEEPPPPALAEESPPLDLAQLEMALDPGFGSLAGAGDFAIRIAAVGSADGGKGVDEMFSLADLDQRPAAISQPMQPLPAVLKKQTPATVYVLFTVDPSGRVENPVVQSSSDPAFEATALGSIRQWKFEPGKRGGKPVRFRMRVPITFPK